MNLFGKWLVILALGLVFLPSGCAPPATTATLVGTYRIEHRVGTKSHGVETLVLHANGTYSQTFVPSRKGPTMTNTGTWSYHDGRVWLDNALVVPDPILDIKQYPVEKTNVGMGVGTFGGISFVKDADSSLYYRRVP